MLKKFILKLFTLTIALILLSSNSFASSNHYFTTQKFSNGKTANYVILNLNASDISFGVGISNNKIFSADSLQNIVKLRTPQSQKSFAAVNGTYFSAYNGVPIPYGTIIDNKKLLHIGNSGAVFGITKDKKMVIDTIDIQIEGSIDGVENQYYAWGLNHPRNEADAIIIFTPEFSDYTSMPNAKNVVIKNGIVSEINNGNTLIPKDGYVISFNPNVQSLAERFSYGSSVDYKAIFKSTRPDATEADNAIWNDVVCAVGAGPSLIINNNITADGTKEGFSEPKINTQRAQRSFIGFREDGRVILGTVSNASIIELSQICKELNLKSAINLDGGASSSLIYNGAYKTKPGRNINNALIFFENQK